MSITGYSNRDKGARSFVIIQIVMSQYGSINYRACAFGCWESSPLLCNTGFYQHGHQSMLEMLKSCPGPEVQLSAVSYSSLACTLCSNSGEVIKHIVHGMVPSVEHGMVLSVEHELLKSWVCLKPCSTPCSGPCSTPCSGPCSTPCSGPCSKPCSGPCSTPCSGPCSTPCSSIHKKWQLTHKFIEVVESPFRENTLSYLSAKAAYFRVLSVWRTNGIPHLWKSSFCASNCTI